MSYTDIIQLLGAAGSVFTALGVLVAIYQLYLAGRLAQTQFEDSMSKEYRDIAINIPTKALMGHALSEAELQEHLDQFYRYFDLTNQQIFTRQRKRISHKTWVEWRGGIKNHLQRTAFAEAWKYVKENCEDFKELRRLEDESFASDPYTWR